MIRSFRRNTTQVCLLVCAVFVFALLPTQVFAQTDCTGIDSNAGVWNALGFGDQDSIEDAVKASICQPVPRIKIPGLYFTDSEAIVNNIAIEPTGETFLYIPFIGQYIRAVYQFSVAAASIIAVVAIIIGGLIWVSSGGSQDRTQSAKKIIVNALTGLLLAVGSYVILFTINPDLVEFKSLRIQFVPPEFIYAEGIPPTQAELGGYNYTSANSIDGLDCQLALLQEYAATNNTFGLSNGSCLSWTLEAMEAMCTKIPLIVGSPGAWDTASDFQKKGLFHPCNLDGIEDGDLFFGVSIGSNYINLWKNFRYDAGMGCTIADAAAKPQKASGGSLVPYKSVVRNAPKGMPPVTHVGIYYQGKVYHLYSKVEEDSISSMARVESRINTRDTWWDGVELQGNFLRSGRSLFVAGYGDLTP